MADNNDMDVNAVANCEDEEMMSYKKCSLNVITFHIVYNENDLKRSPHKKSNTFKPDMSHQIFGATEMIFGYRQLSINLYYLHNSSKCYVDVQANEKITEGDCKADDIMQALNQWLPANYRLNKDEFKKDLGEEKHAVIHGETIQTFRDEQGRIYKVTLCDLKSEDFKNFHQRFETFIIWFIDGANFIDLEDERWTIFYVYEEHLDYASNEIYHTPVGFCTVYKFFLYPNSVRPRISQFFVLPTHQKRGIGTKLYASVYDYLKHLPDSGDITVEEPTPLFQRIRDLCDSLNVYKDLQENKINISTHNEKRINEYLKKHKLCKRQAQRVFDILECLITHKNGYKEYVKFTDNIRKRISNEIEKETRGSKRLCNLERTGIVTEPIDKKAAVDAEYNKYIDSLEWPVNHLRAHLAKSLFL